MTTEKKPSILQALQGRVREVLKSINESAPKKDGEEGDETTVPVPPESPSGMETDPRVGDASPTEGDLDAAADQSAAAGGADGGLPPEGDGDGDEGAGASAAADGDGDEEGDGVGFDAHGNRDFSPDEVRGMQKAYGNGTGQAEAEELLKGGKDVLAILTQILDALEDLAVRHGASIDEMRADVNKLKTGQTATERTLSKALADIKPLLDPKPKAATKSFGGGVKVPPPPALPDSGSLFLQMQSGKLSPFEAQALVRSAKSQGLDV